MDTEQVMGSKDTDQMMGPTEQLMEEVPEPLLTGTVSSDYIFELFARKRSWKYTVMILYLMVVWMGGPSCVYLTSFAGWDSDRIH